MKIITISRRNFIKFITLFLISKDLYSSTPNKINDVRNFFDKSLKRYRFVFDSKDKIKVNNKLLRENDPKIIVSNPNKIQKHFGWKAEEEISKWLKKIIDYEINFQNLN